MAANLDLQLDNRVKTAKKSQKPERPLTARIWFVGVAVRSLFLIILAVLTVRVASPQIEQMSRLSETPSDLIRVGLGLAVGLWLVVHIFMLPKDPGAFRTWIFLGMALLPLSLLCTFVVW